MRTLRKTITQHRTFLGILIAASALYFFIISRVSVEGDASHFAFRALGWLDWFTGQEGAMKFVGHHQWWMDLSFQDHPPGVFFIQHYFFKFLGESSFIALLPSVVAGLLTIIVIYWGVLRLVGKETALWAALFLATDAYATHMFTNGYHEGVTTFFIVASFITLLMYIETERERYVVLSAMALGLSLISKYTAVFGVAGFFATLFSGTHLRVPLQRMRDQKWRIILCAGLCVAILSPVIIYNIELFRTAHLLDSAIASMVGTENVFDGRPRFNVLANIISTVQTLVSVNNPLFIITSLCALAWLGIKCLRENTSNFERGLLIYVAFLFLMFAFIGGATRFQPIFMPFLVMIVAIGITDLRQKFPGKVSQAAILFFFVFGLAYCINTHVLPHSFGWAGITFSEERGHDFGLKSLDAHLRNIMGPLPELERPNTIEDVFRIGLPSESPPDAKEIIIFDSRFNFFAIWWYLERYTLLHRKSLYPVSAPISQKMLGGPRFDRSVLPSSETPVYYIYVLNKGFMNPHMAGDPWPEYLAKLFETNQMPYDTISDVNGEPVFRVYKLNP